MTLQELLAESLERLGASGLASPTAKTVYDKNYRPLNGFLRPLRRVLGDDNFYNAKCRVVWSSADGTLFPSAEERDAYSSVRQKL